MARAEIVRTESPETEVKDKSQVNSSWRMKNLQFRSKFDEMSDGDINSSTDSSTSSSASASISLPRQQQQPQPQQQRQNEVASSSSSFTSVDLNSSSSSSSSSSGSTSVSAPQHVEEGNFDGSNREKESGSAKLQRILYGSSSSSYDDEYVIMSSSDSSSRSFVELNYDGKRDEDGSVSRILYETDSLDEEDSASKVDIVSVEENEENTKERIDAMSSPKSEERSGVSPPLSPGTLNEIDDEVDTYGVTLSSQDHMSSNDKDEGENSGSSNGSLEIQSKQSQSHRENDEKNDTSTHSRGAMAVSMTSLNFSIDSRSRSSTTKDKPSMSMSSNLQSSDSLRDTKKGSASKNSRTVSNPSAKSDESKSSSQRFMKAQIEVTTGKVVIDSKKQYGDQNSRGISKFAKPISTSSKIPEDPPIVNSAVVNSRGASEDEVERKKSTKLVGAEEKESDKVGWMPPALTTFSISNYEKSEKENLKRKVSNAGQFAIRLELENRPTVVENTTVERRRKKQGWEMPSPISQIIVKAPSDEESTLGTDGTYLERFPENSKEKRKEKPTANDPVSTLELSKKMTIAVGNKPLADGNSGGTEKLDAKVQIRPVKDEDNFPGKVENKLLDDSKLSSQQRPASSDKKFSTLLLSRTRKFENSRSEKGDPPGDVYLFSYNPHHSQQQQLPFGSSDPTPADSFDHMDKNKASSEPASSARDSISPHHTAQQHLLPSPLPMTSWIPSNIHELEGERDLDLDPTRTFVDSLLSQKRSSTSTHSITDHHVQQQSEIRAQSQVSKEASGGTGSENSISQSHDLMDMDTSKSTSKNISDPIEKPTSGSSSSLRSYEMKVFGNSSSSTDESRQIYRSKFPTSVPWSQPTHMFNAPSNSKATDSLHDVEHTKESSHSSDTSILLHNEPRGMQHQSGKGEYKYHNSQPPSSRSSSVSEHQFSEQVDRQLSRRGNRKTTVLLIWFLAVLIIATAIIVVVLWQLEILFVPLDDDSEYTTIPLPTSKPLADIERLIIEAYPQGQPALEDPNSPQSKALKWLGSSKNSGISEKQSLLQRYVLATVYYSTNGDDWTDSTGWLSEEDECYWMSTAQSACDDLGEYIVLDLQENNLVGTLPVELGILSDTIRSINVRNNFLLGEIPSSMISNLQVLQILDLSSNNFSGVLNKKLFEATSLTRLSLFENNLSSSIPTEIGQLTKLDVLDLGSNKLTSTIPSTVEKLSKLAGLSLFDNMLTGTIPIELSSIQNLKMLYIDSNNFEGPLPKEVCLLNINDFWGDCEEIQCTCCTTCCADNFGCFVV